MIFNFVHIVRCIQQIDASLLCVCLLVDDKFRQNVVKLVMDPPSALDSRSKMIVLSQSLHQNTNTCHPSVLFLTIQISQSAREKIDIYVKVVDVFGICSILRRPGMRDLILCCCICCCAVDANLTRPPLITA